MEDGDRVMGEAKNRGGSPLRLFLSLLSSPNCGEKEREREREREKVKGGEKDLKPLLIQYNIVVLVLKNKTKHYYETSDEPKVVLEKLQV